MFREKREMDKGKRKHDDGYDGSNKRRGDREPKFTTYIDRTENLKRIYLETRRKLPFQKPPRKSPTERQRRSERYCLFHELEEHTTDEYRHLKDMVEEHISSDKLSQYVRNQTVAVEHEQLPLAPNRNDLGWGSRLVIN